jgi:hypothetical protein
MPPAVAEVIDPKQEATATLAYAPATTPVPRSGRISRDRRLICTLAAWALASWLVMIPARAHVMG